MEEKQKHADFGADVGEASTEVKWRQPSFAKGEASQQVERDGGEAPTTCDASKDRETNDDQPEFD
jgi:hypothetical protein